MSSFLLLHTAANFYYFSRELRLKLDDDNKESEIRKYDETKKNVFLDHEFHFTSRNNEDVRVQNLLVWRFYSRSLIYIHRYFRWKYNYDLSHSTAIILSNKLHPSYCKCPRNLIKFYVRNIVKEVYNFPQQVKVETVDSYENTLQLTE